MNTTNCGCQTSCTGRAIVASVIIGVLAAFFRFAALITIAPAFLWVLFGIALVFLGIILLTSTFQNSEKNGCCRCLIQFLTGILGTIFTTVILLGITFAATSIIGAIITGLLLFFFSLFITSATCVVTCRLNCN